MILPNLILLLLSGPADAALDVSISLPADSLEPDGSYSVRIEYDLADGWSASDAGMPHPLLQIKAPDSVELAGKQLTDYRELAKNEFLRAPFERLLTESPAQVKFKLLREPADGDRLAFSVLAYVSRQDQQDAAWFVRKRFELPLKPGAEAAAITSKPSAWVEQDLLGIGERAEPFELPRADGSKLALEPLLGKRMIVLTTYRAFW